MGKKIVYIVGGLVNPNGMTHVLSQKINYLAENTDFDMYMVLTECAGKPFYYKISDKVKYVNFDINFDELDTMPILKKLFFYIIKQHKFKRMLTEYLMKIHPDITESICRREINFINNIQDGSRKIGEIHFNKSNYRKFDKPYFPHFMNKYISDKWMNSFIRQVKQLDKFIVLSNEDRKEWKGLDNVEVIYNPLSYFPKEQSACENKKVIAAGRYTWQKGFDMLIDAWRIVAKRHSDWHLDIYGAGNNEYYQKLADKKKLNWCLTCHPSTDNIYKEYMDSSIFVLSSRYEGFGLVLAEAMSAGLPVVSFACPCGPKDIIADGTDGILVDKNDVNKLADSINYLIENELERKRMGKNAVIKSHKFEEKTIMEQWIRLFDSIE